MKQSKKINIDMSSGSMAYNRLDMQLSQTLHMAIELYDDLNYLFVLDYYDDIALFDIDKNPYIVSYYQMKTSNNSITMNTAISEDWLSKLYSHLHNTDYLVKELGLITNIPITITVSKKESLTGKKQTYKSDDVTKFNKYKAETIKKIKDDISKKFNIPVDDVDLSKFIHIKTVLTLEKHRDIVEKELSDFLYNKYPKISVDIVKSIYVTLMDLLTKKQEKELVENSSFDLVRKNKGITKNDINNIIRANTIISLPILSDVLKLFSKDIELSVMKAYTEIEIDMYKNDNMINKLSQKIDELMEINVIDTNSISEYFFKIVSKLKNTNKKLSIIYNDMYLNVLCACIYINRLRYNNE